MERRKIDLVEGADDKWRWQGDKVRQREECWWERGTGFLLNISVMMDILADECMHMHMQGHTHSDDVSVASGE